MATGSIYTKNCTFQIPFYAFLPGKISSILAINLAIVLTGTPWMLVALAMIGKLAITSSYGAIYVFTAEQFPTVVRNVGLGASSTFARIGGVIAPYINHLVSLNTHKN